MERRGVWEVLHHSEETVIRFDANDNTFEFVGCCCWYKYSAGHQTENFCVWVFFPHCWSSHFTNCCALLKLHEICHLHNAIPSARFTRFDPLFPSHPSTFPLRWRCCRDLTWSKKVSDPPSWKFDAFTAAYCWWFRYPVNQLIWQIFLVIYRVLYIPSDAGVLNHQQHHHNYTRVFSVDIGTKYLCAKHV